MSVNKRLLEEKTNQELEEYIKPESKFVQEASQYAFEILKSRGRIFTDEETERFSSNTIKENKITKVVHPNYKKSADILYVSAFLSIGSLIWTYETIQNGLQIFITVSVLAFVFALAYFTGKGLEWFKYLLLVLLLLGLSGLPSMVSTLQNDPVLGILGIIQSVLQIWSLILLFKIPKNTTSNNSDF